MPCRILNQDATILPVHENQKVKLIKTEVKWSWFFALYKETIKKINSINLNLKVF